MPGRRSPSLVALLAALLVGDSALGAPLTTIELVQEEEKQYIRIRAQGPLPYQVLRLTADELVLFLPRGEMGMVPPVVALSPLADLRVEGNPAGVRLTFENLLRRPRVIGGQRPGVIEVRFPEPPKPEPTPATAPAPTVTTGASPANPTGTLPPTGSAPQVGGKPLNCTQNRDPSSGVAAVCNAGPQPGSSSDQAEEDPDPPSPGIPPAPARPRAPAEPPVP